LSFEIAVQVAVYDKLKESAELSALVSDRIYDHVPQKVKECDKKQDMPFPYVTIGEDIHIDWSTYEKTGDECQIAIHTWSREKGRKEVKTIQGAIRTALDRVQLQYDGVCFVAIDWRGSSSELDPDGLTYHGVSEFRILTR
jgi:hypothetical protein